MIICNFHIMRIAIQPDKANAPLIIDSYTILPFTVAAKLFESVCRRNPQVIDILSVINHA